MNTGVIVTEQSLYQNKMADSQQETDPHQLITKQDVEQALKADKGFDVSLESYEIKDFTSKGDNYASLVSSVEVLFRKSGKKQEISYVAKINLCRPSLLDAGDLMDRVFAKEIQFYTKVVPLLDKELQKVGESSLRFPKHYHSVETKGRQVIYFEDLRRIGFKMYNRQLAMDEGHAVLVINELARLHASSSLLQKNLAVDLTEKFDIFSDEQDTFKSMDDAMVANVFGTFFESTAQITDQVPGYGFVSEFLRKWKPELKGILADLLSVEEPFKFITHGDVWSNNLLFRYSTAGVPEDCRLLDLQVTRVASPAIDLNQMIYPNLDSSLRRGHLSNFLASYYATFSSVLAGTGVPMGFTLPELKKEFASKQMYGLIFAIMVVPTTLCDPKNLPETEDFFKGNKEGVLDSRREMVNKFLLGSPSLRPRLLDLFDDMKEYGVFSNADVSNLVHSFNKRASLKK